MVSTAAGAARVLICHDWAVAREGMRTQLQDADGLEVVETTESGMSAVIAAMSGTVDVIVTGCRLEGIDGTEVVRRVTEEVDAPHVKVIALLPQDDPDLIVDLLRFRPHGVIPQECSSEELRFTVRGVAAGRTVLGSPVAGHLLEWYRSAVPAPRAAAETPDGDRAGATPSLTAREVEVLELVAEGCSTEEVADDLTISLTTVRSHLFRLRSKIGVRDRAGLVNFAFRTGVVRVA